MTDHSPVTVYTRPGCRPCKRVLEKLEAADVPYEVVDLSDPAFADALSYITNVLGAKTVPVIITEAGDVYTGYQPDKLKAICDAYGLTLNGESTEGRSPEAPSFAGSEEGAE